MEILGFLGHNAHPQFFMCLLHYSLMDTLISLVPIHQSILIYLITWPFEECMCIVSMLVYFYVGKKDIHWKWILRDRNGLWSLLPAYAFWKELSGLQKVSKCWSNFLIDGTWQFLYNSIVYIDYTYIYIYH